MPTGFGTEIPILIVDDSKADQIRISAFLSELGFSNFLFCDDGDRAFFEMLRASEAKTPFKLIVCDMMLPKLRGIDLYVKMKRFDGLKHTPFIIMTGKGEEKHVLELIKTGVRHILIKPVTMESLKEKLDEIKMTQDKKN